MRGNEETFKHPAELAFRFSHSQVYPIATSSYIAVSVLLNKTKQKTGHELRKTTHVNTFSQFQRLYRRIKAAGTKKVGQ